MEVVVNEKTKRVGCINEKSIAFNYRSVVELAGKKVKDKPVVAYFSGSDTGQLFHNGDGVRVDVEDKVVFSVVDAGDE
jgi:hypothetical protein